LAEACRHQQSRFESNTALILNLLESAKVEQVVNCNAVVRDAVVRDAVVRDAVVRIDCLARLIVKPDHDAATGWNAHRI
jgi:hypothetical protein